MLMCSLIVGKVFLSRVSSLTWCSPVFICPNENLQVYLSVVYHENTFRLAHLTQDTLQGRPSPPELAPFNCVSQGKRKVNVRAVVGGTVGGVLGSLLLLLILWCKYPRLFGRKSKGKVAPRDANVPTVRYNGENTGFRP
jgi:hypothetical protein